MAVATMGAASLGPVFQELCDQVTQSMEKNAKFKTLLGYLQCSLNSVKERIIQLIQKDLHLREEPETVLDELTEPLMIRVQKGLKLITDKFSKLRRWELYYCMDDYTLELLLLDSSLRALLEGFWVRRLDSVRQRLIRSIMQYSQHSTDPQVYNMMNKHLQTIVDTYEEAWETKPMAPEERNHEEGEGMDQPAMLVFDTLVETVHEVMNRKKTPVMFKLLLDDIFDRLWLLTPFMEQKAKAFDGQDEELRNFKAKMVKGVEIVRKCSSRFGSWGGYSKRKYECINDLLGLNQSLERLLCITRWVEVRGLQEELHLMKHMNTAMNEFNNSYLVQNQTERSADGKECEEGLTESSSVVARNQANCRKALAFCDMMEKAMDEFRCSRAVQNNQTRFAGSPNVGNLWKKPGL